MLFDLGTGVGVDDDDHVLEAGGEGVRGDEVDHGLAVHAYGRELLEAAVASSATRGEDDERGFGHYDQRTIAEAQVMPAPKPVMSAYSPGLIRPFWRASSKASGIDALEVLP